MRPLMLVRFPKLRAPAASWPVIPADRRAPYPSLAPDFQVLDREVAPAFTEADLAALRHQNRYRRQQVLILLGSAALTGLGGLQALFTDQRWPGLLLAVLGVLLAATGRATRELDDLKDYLNERVKAERLRALHFRFLSRTGPYAGADREANLQRAVVAIQFGKEPT
ncbi:Protein of unknown function [Geodermatophilus africanus]|uniref:SMODS and SLOG-associating 2TM effector domain-containing protein n=1 Tax=Geodermatophilus africanus TaxID=1137993 RepID=A0A1H3R1D3_9ACTN|nr:DUF4231 domain-containing protein [Geodermatophilus africanus]SDZ19420.1 Protein of unknown function [Geodermatophilus africanus]